MKLTVKQAAEHFGVFGKIIRRWADAQKLEIQRTHGGHRRIVIDDRKACTIFYCRVSSYGQKDDLEVQVKFAKEKYPNAELVTDIGSGLSFRRKGLKTILERAMSGMAVTFVVAHKDRLCRFGFELIEWMLKQSGGRIVVLNQTELSPEQEFTEDLCAIIHVFSCRLY